MLRALLRQVRNSLAIMTITMTMTIRNCLTCHGRSPFADNYNYDIISTILLPSLLTLITFLVNTNA